MPSRPAEYFEQLYAKNADPWGFETSAYEREKYAATLEALGGGVFESGFEIGCSIGVLTRQLAMRCNALLACDVAEGALEQAARRCAGLTNLRFERRQIPRDWPEAAEKFDLLVFSEVLYFLEPREIEEAARLACGSLRQEGLVVLVNYTGPIPEACSGDEAAELFISAARKRLRCIRQRREEKFRIDVLSV